MQAGPKEQGQAGFQISKNCHTDKRYAGVRSQRTKRLFCSKKKVAEFVWEIGTVGRPATRLGHAEPDRADLLLPYIAISAPLDKQLLLTELPKSSTLTRLSGVWSRTQAC